MKILEALSCPNCGSSDLKEIAEKKVKCSHCGATSILSSDRTELTIAEWICPNCGFNNDKQASFCGKCGKNLTKPCIPCGNEMRWDLNCCPNCGFMYKPGEKIIYYRSFRPFWAYVLTDKRLISLVFGEQMLEILPGMVQSIVVKAKQGILSTNTPRCIIKVKGQNVKKYFITDSPEEAYELARNIEHILCS